jgi:transcriptional regulator with XRE-family HTH domain
MDPLTAIVTALEARRLDMNMSKKELASHAHVSRPALDRLLAGSDVQFSTVLAVAGVLGLNMAMVPRSVASALGVSYRSHGAPATLEVRPANGTAERSPGPQSAVQARLQRLRSANAAASK